MVQVTILFAAITLLLASWILKQVQEAEHWDRTMYWILSIPWVILLTVLWAFWWGSVRR